MSVAPPPSNNYGPQWTNAQVFNWQHETPVWKKNALVAVRGTSVDQHLCTTCRLKKEKCVCDHCAVCYSSIGMGSRHHCRSCWKAVCSKCRSKTRYLNAMAATNTTNPVCDKCACYRGIPQLSEDTRFVGLYLLREATDMPRQCVGRQCKSLTYRLSCPSCSLPTVPNCAHVERLVRVELCCKWSSKCAKCSNAEQRMALEERRIREERISSFQNLSQPQIDAAFELDKRKLDGVFKNVDDDMTRNIMLATVCASVCYEYSAYPHTTLSLSDIPYACLLHMKETAQLYSVFEGPNKTIFIAIPGTHDLRTTITDVKFTRVKETEWGTLHNGFDANGRAVRGGVHSLWEYKIHAGFYEEEIKLRHAFPTNICRDYVAQGYTIIFCGHSLGGALASLMTIRHLSEDLPTFQGKIKCVTLGSPLIGNSALTRRIERCGWTEYFHHLVYRSDIVPRLLTGRQLHKEAITSAKRKVVEAATSIKNLFSRKSDTVSDETPELQLDERAVSEAFLEDENQSPTAEEIAHQQSIPYTKTLFGAKRPFDCFGRYHFLHRDVVYKSTTCPDEAYHILKSGDGLNVAVMDHLLDSYNRSIALQVTK